MDMMTLYTLDGTGLWGIPDPCVGQGRHKPDSLHDQWHQLETNHSGRVRNLNVFIKGEKNGY